MSRYSAMFERLGDEGAFGAFLMLGDPDLQTSARLLDALVEGGADMIEVGIPFSDPVADGPVIQAAAQRALSAGVRVSDCLELLAGFRSRHPTVPVGILTYANIVAARMGFMRDAYEAGADSLLIADVPALEVERFTGEMEQAGIEPVLIAAANTPEPTLRRIACLSKAYTYCVSGPGIFVLPSQQERKASFAVRQSWKKSVLAKMLRVWYDYSKGQRGNESCSQ